MARLFLLIALTMVAFAANSVLNRAALAGGEAGPASFAALRTVSGAVCLFCLVRARGERMPQPKPRSWVGVLSLSTYMVGFSFAYIALDAGTGALILFGGTQITMFAGALIAGERPSPWRWIGTIFAFGGLVWLLWPGAVGAPRFIPAALMTAAALGWGLYSLAGRGSSDPLRDTAANFVWASPIMLALLVFLFDGVTARGVVLAILSGAITSGLGYALWYAILPKIDTSLAALSQLSVPIIAAFGGVLILSEPPTARMILAAFIVLGGIAIGVLGAQRTRGSSGS